MTLQERRDYAQSFEKLAEQLARTGRHASAEETRRLEDLRFQAKAGLAAEVFRREAPEKAVQKHPELVAVYDYMRR